MSDVQNYQNLAASHQFTAHLFVLWRLVDHHSGGHSAWREMMTGLVRKWLMKELPLSNHRATVDYIQKKLRELYTIEVAEWYNSTANLARDLILAHYKCLRQFALEEVQTLEPVNTVNTANKFKEIVLAIGYLKEPLDFCSELLSKLKNGINLFKRDFPLIWSRHLLFRVYQLILLAARCSTENRPDQLNQLSQPLVSKDVVISVLDTTISRQRQLKVKRLLEKYEKLNEQFFTLPKHRFNVLIPQFSVTNLAEVFNSAPKSQSKSKSKSASVKHESFELMVTTTKIPTALIHIFHGYCWLHPLSEHDVELVEQSLLR